MYNMVKTILSLLMPTLMLLLPCEEGQESDMNDFYSELRNFMSDDETVNRVERLALDLDSIDMMEAVYSQYFFKLLT